jgi:7-cyano-7-deazaguanine tRNA-ribosyltransferase
MARRIFEVREWDNAARLGRLTVPSANVTVETPALLPVVNPHKQTIPPARLASEFGVEILITNAYILYGSSEFRQKAVNKGLHELYEFDGAIMTDSGSFQLAEYGDITVDTKEILQFQYDIGSDIGTPVDIPTPPDAPVDRARSELEETELALSEAASVDVGEMLVNAPIQGSTHLELREAAAAHAYATDLDVFPIGAVVPLLNAYRYDDMVDIIAAAKQGLEADAPVHLFGAGHPMMFALAVAMGCDLFDSAAYALYARDGRYLTVRGTEQLTNLEYLPCSCPICVEHTPSELRAENEDKRTQLLAEHNLHVTFEEMRRVKQAIRGGSLLELVETRIRGHPTLVDGFHALLSHADTLESSDPISKGAFFHLSAESANRPEVLRHQERLTRLTVEGATCLLTTGSGNSDDHDVTWRVVPPFGPFPRALSESYPLTAEIPKQLSANAYERAATGVVRLIEANPEVSFSLAHHQWPESATAKLPDSVEIRQYGERTDPPDL